LWKELNDKAFRPHKRRRDSVAIKVAGESLSVAKKTFGPDHLNVATVLENMAELYNKTGKKDEAKRLEERAKRIRSKSQ